MLKLQLKALMARDMWEMNVYYRIINDANNIYQRGLATIKDERYEHQLSE